MKKIFFYLLFFLLYKSNAFCQQQTIEYGNNKAAGRYYNIRGFPMYCEVYGKGQPLLMIHGNAGSINAFEKNIPYFAQKYMVVVADSRAQGKSIDLRDSLSFEMMADDEAALLDSLHIHSAYIIGWSDGGIIALLMAIRHPQKVMRLAVSGANLWPDSTAITRSLWLNEKEQYEKTDVNNIKTPEQKNDWKLFLLDWLQPHIPPGTLHSIKCLSLIICGDHDLIKLQHTILIYRNIPHDYLWVVSNSGHGTLQEHADEFNKKVDYFFRENIRK